jgi:hypothetical protein
MGGRSLTRHFRRRAQRDHLVRNNRHAPRLKRTELCRTIHSRSKRAPPTMAGPTTTASNEEADRLYSNGSRRSSRNTLSHKAKPLSGLGAAREAATLPAPRRRAGRYRRRRADARLASRRLHHRADDRRRRRHDNRALDRQNQKHPVRDTGEPASGSAGIRAIIAYWSSLVTHIAGDLSSSLPDLTAANSLDLS